MKGHWDKKCPFLLTFSPFLFVLLDDHLNQNLAKANSQILILFKMYPPILTENISSIIFFKVMWNLFGIEVRQGKRISRSI